MKLLRVLFLEEATSLVQFFRYAAVSGIALIVDLGLLYVGVVILNLHYLVAASLSFAVGVVLVYIGSIYWVFPKRAINNYRKEVTVFVLIGLAGLVLNDVLLLVLIELLDQYLWLAKASTVIIVFLFNFTIRKFLLFS
jgi:putative flippase GtrA